MLPILGPLLSGGLSLITGWLKHKQKMTEATRLAELKWAESMAKASATSWKDEYLTLVFTIPLILGMLGWTEPIDELFRIMRTAPEWYTVVILTIVGGSFGIVLYDKVKRVRYNGSAPQPPPAHTEEINDG